jgi:hypothetical protein
LKTDCTCIYVVRSAPFTVLPVFQFIPNKTTNGAFFVFFQHLGKSTFIIFFPCTGGKVFDSSVKDINSIPQLKCNADIKSSELFYYTLVLRLRGYKLASYINCIKRTSLRCFFNIPLRVHKNENFWLRFWFFYYFFDSYA